MMITQTTHGAIIDWASFNIGSGYEVKFEVPDASAVTLNRVVSFSGAGYDVSSSLIDGKLSSNGNVFIINPAGITFGSGSQVNVGGLIASTLWLSDTDFGNGLKTGDYNFEGFNGDPATTHQIRNDGEIIVGAGGAGFVGTTLRNSGNITASNGGTIGFGAGESVQITIDPFGDGLTQVTVDGPRVGSTIIQDVAGSMIANGGSIQLLSGGNVDISGALRAQTMASVIGSDTGGIMRAQAMATVKGSDAGGDVLVRNLTGDLILNADISGSNIELVTAGRLQNQGGASLNASGHWNVWANTWEGETRAGLSGSGDLPNLYGREYPCACDVTVTANDNHFIYVQQPTASITFADTSREYGRDNLALNFSVTGAILGDRPANVATGDKASTIATVTSDVGLYPITGSFTSLAGYRIQLVPGTLSVTPATLFFTADSAVRYLGTRNPKFTGTVTGFRNGDSVESVFGTADIWSSPADFSSQAGFHSINGGSSAKNYVFDQAPSNATGLQVIPLSQLSATPIDLVRETINTYVYDRNFGGAPVCALSSSLSDEKIASTGDALSNEWSKVRSRPNLTNCFETERKDGCGSF